MVLFSGIYYVTWCTAGEEGADVDNANPKSAKKVIKEKLQNKRNQIIEDSIDDIANKIVGHKTSDNAGERVFSEESENSVGRGRSRKGDSSDSRDAALAMTCDKCGYTADSFPYSDKTKKKVKCPSCGALKSLN